MPRRAQELERGLGQDVICDPPQAHPCDRESVPATVLGCLSGGWGVGAVLERQTDGQGCGSQSWDLQVSLIQSSGPAASSGHIHFIALCPSPRPFYPTVTAGHRGAVPSGWRTEGQGGDVRVSFEKPRLGLRLFG